ncbi:hypothetical protein D3C71_691870 [compost metagenome]
MNIIYPKTNTERVSMFLKAMNQFPVTSGGFDRDYIGIQGCNGINNIVEFTVAHMCMDLSCIADGRCT